MDLSNFNSIFEVFGGVLFAITGIKFFRYALLKTLRNSFDLYLKKNEKNDSEIREELSEVSELLKKKYQDWKIRKKIKFKIAKFRYKYFVPKPDIEKKPKFEYNKDLLDRVIQATTFHTLLYCIVILILNGYCVEQKNILLPFSYHIFNRSVYLEPQKLVLSYVFVSILLAFLIAIHFGYDRNKSFYNRSITGVLFISLKGLYKIVIFHCLFFLISIFLSVYFGNQLKYVLTYSRIYGLGACVLPILISSFLYQYSSFKLRRWFYKVRKHNNFYLYLKKISRDEVINHDDIYIQFNKSDFSSLAKGHYNSMSHKESQSEDYYILTDYNYLLGVYAEHIKKEVEKKKEEQKNKEQIKERFKNRKK